jgi:SAM-dependent methyltransferase
LALTDHLKAKRHTGGPVWRAAFSLKDALDAARRARAKAQEKKRRVADLMNEVHEYRQRAAPPRPPLEDFHLRSAVLRTSSEVDAAIAQVRSLGLVPHDGTHHKNWDTLASLSAILRTTTPSARILDAGSAIRSKILPWLAAYGYTSLVGIDLSFRSKLRVGDILYLPGDLTQTSFPDGHFDAVTCISVIEHGVDPARYFDEMWRILKPGGILITSTDYWPERLDTSGLDAWDAPWTIFDRTSLQQVVDTGKARGFLLEGPLALDAQAPVVSWRQRHYTFAYVAMRKPPR